MTRRDMLWLVASVARAQQSTGMASRGLAPQPRGKSSGLPFHARFTDIAAQAGLREPVIYGPAARTDYILESMGCGVAFFDYDNDGWLDVFVLSGTRREGPVAGATNRLYRNNRDGTFTDVTKESGLIRQDWACGVTIGDYNNDGFDDITITAMACWICSSRTTWCSILRRFRLLAGIPSATSWASRCIAGRLASNPSGACSIATMAMVRSPM
ncbi:MAG: VCBS repeat-containing protein [Bryobacteraceae bacterium]